MRIDVAVVIAWIQSRYRHLWIDALVTGDGDRIVDRSVQTQSLDVLADLP